MVFNSCVRTSAACALARACSASACSIISRDVIISSFSDQVPTIGSVKTLLHGVIAACVLRCTFIVGFLLAALVVRRLSALYGTGHAGAGGFVDARWATGVIDGLDRARIAGPAVAELRRITHLCCSFPISANFATYAIKKSRYSFGVSSRRRYLRRARSSFRRTRRSSAFIAGTPQQAPSARRAPGPACA